MKRPTPIYRKDDLPRTGPASEVITYKLAPEEIEARYGHIKPIDRKKQRGISTTAPQLKPLMFYGGGSA